MHTVFVVVSSLNPFETGDITNGIYKCHHNYPDAKGVSPYVNMRVLDITIPS